MVKKNSNSKEETNIDVSKLTKKAKKHQETLEKVKEEIQKVIVGQEDVIKKVIIALCSQGNILLEGVPGLAKTLLVKTLSDAINANYSRIQFTPDLLPSDIVGTKIYDSKSSKFNTKKGPIFANFILADEINRAPPKVQSALLEAMQEKQVTISGDTFFLETPFMVLATQNPIESEGTYNLPEAQLDRFALKLNVNQPNLNDSKEIITRFTTSHKPTAKKVITKEDILDIQNFVRDIYVDEKVIEYISKIVHATSHPKDYRIDAEHLIDFGASPRALIWLTVCAKANAVLMGRGFVVPQDVKDVVFDVLRHRIILSYEAESENITTDNIIEMIIEKIKAP